MLCSHQAIQCSIYNSCSHNSNIRHSQPDLVCSPECATSLAELWGKISCKD
jgi:hypothetical protein